MKVVSNECRYATKFEEPKRHERCDGWIPVVAPVGGVAMFYSCDCECHVLTGADTDTGVPNDG